MEGDGHILPEPLDKKKFSGKFVLRVEPAIHRRLAANLSAIAQATGEALAAGESLNTYCVKNAGEGVRPAEVGRKNSQKTQKGQF